MAVSDFLDLKSSYVFFGLSVLLPWNAVLSLMYEYNMYVMPNGGTDPVKNMGLGTSAYSTASIVMMLLLSAVGSKLSLKKQMIFGFFFLTLAMGAFCGMALMEFGTDLMFYLTMIVCVTIGLSGGMGQGSMFASAGLLNSQLSVSGMVGVGASGIVGFALVVLVKIFLPYPQEDALKPAHFAKILLIFASLSTTIIGATLIAIFAMMRRADVKVRFGEAQEDAAASVCAVAQLSDGGEIVAIGSEAEAKLVLRSPAAQPMLAAAGSASEMDAALLDPLDEVKEENDEASLPSRGLWAVIKSAYPMMWSNCSYFLMTFLVFPSVSLRMRAHGQVIDSADAGNWFGVMVIGSYQVGDLLGRLLLEWGLKAGKTTIVVFSFLRYALVPLFVLAVRSDTTYEWMLNDFYQLALVMFLGISAGWGASHTFLYVGDYLKRDAEKQQAGFLMSLILLTGITIGAQGAYLVLPYC